MGGKGRIDNLLKRENIFICKPQELTDLARSLFHVSGGVEKNRDFGIRRRLFLISDSNVLFGFGLTIILFLLIFWGETSLDYLRGERVIPELTEQPLRTRDFSFIWLSHCQRCCTEEAVLGSSWRSYSQNVDPRSVWIICYPGVWGVYFSITIISFNS